MKKTIIVIITVLSLFLLTGCETDNNSSNGNNNNSNNNYENNQNNSDNGKYTVNQKFTFDELEIVIGDKISFTKVDNRYSDHHKKDVVKVPVSIKNISNDTHGLNMFYYNIYGSKGTKIDGVTSFFDNTVDDVGDMRSGAEQNTFFYFLYDGDGDYYIEFDNWSDKIEVKIPVKK